MAVVCNNCSLLLPLVARLLRCVVWCSRPVPVDHPGGPPHQGGGEEGRGLRVQVAV